MLQHSCCPQQQHVVLLYAAALLLLATTCQACTIFQFQNDGFASNALYLLRAIPIFYGQNGAGTSACIPCAVQHAAGHAMLCCLSHVRACAQPDMTLASASHMEVDCRRVMTELGSTLPTCAGTLYLDNTDFPYACGEDGGFHDFFKDDEHLVPW